MNQEVQNRVRALAQEVSQALGDLPQSLVIDRYESDKSSKWINSEAFRLSLNGMTLYVSVVTDADKAGV